MKTIRRWKLLSTNGSVEMCTTALNLLDTDGGEGGDRRGGFLIFRRL